MQQHAHHVAQLIYIGHAVGRISSVGGAQRGDFRLIFIDDFERIAHLLQRGDLGSVDVILITQVGAHEEGEALCQIAEGSYGILTACYLTGGKILFADRAYNALSLLRQKIRHIVQTAIGYIRGEASAQLGKDVQLLVGGKQQR